MTVRAAYPLDIISNAVGPACPQNWYLVASSMELAPGAILTRMLGDAEIILYRGQHSQRVTAFAAHCAHAGCHLGHGRVVGDDLRCALHHRIIRPDGNFGGSAPRTPSSSSQPAFPAVERFGGIFVFAGEHATFEFPMPEISAIGPVTVRSLPPRTFAVPWSTLISNGMDIDHLQAVHDRKLREPPTFRRIDEHQVRLSYCASVTGSHLSDHVMKWISDDEIRASISCIGGSMMLVESQVGRHRTFVLLSMCPSGTTGSTVRAVVGVPGASHRLGSKISARLAAWLFQAFLTKDVAILERMRWHEPTVEMTDGDALMVRLCDFFRGLAEFEPTHARPQLKAATHLLPVAARPTPISRAEAIR